MRQLPAIVALAAGACFATPAAADYTLCLFTNTSHSPFEVLIGETPFNLGNLQCVTVPYVVYGAVRVNSSHYSLICNASVPMNNTTNVQVTVERVATGESGVQPFMRCGVAFMG